MWFRTGRQSQGKIACGFNSVTLNNLERTQLELLGDRPERDKSNAQSGFDRGLDGFRGIEVHHALKGFQRVGVALLFAGTGAAATIVPLFSTGSPDGKIFTLSRTASTGKLETETAADFVLGQSALVTNATFTGLIVGGATPANINDVEIELYHVFPVDSTNPPDGRVITRKNSPSDSEFAAFDSAAGKLSFTTTVLNSNFPAANSVVNGIHALPNQFTGGEGPVTGMEVRINVTFTTPFLVGVTDHDFFRPEVDLGSSGDFLWLSAPKPIAASGKPFQFPGGPGQDLQTWIRNDGPGALAPDWERVGTDVTHQGPFNASFSLTGVAVPEPSGVLLVAAGLGLLALITRCGLARR
jgi:hypothetical protein